MLLEWNCDNKAVRRRRRTSSSTNNSDDTDDDSSHVIRLVDAMQDDEFIYLVLPYMAGGDLFERVDSTNIKGLSEATAASYLRQMAKVHYYICLLPLLYITNMYLQTLTSLLFCVTGLAFYEG